MSYRPQTMRHADKRVSVAAARNQLDDLLRNARDLDRLDPETLARCYRVPIAEVRRKFDEAKARRERLL